MKVIKDIAQMKALSALWRQQGCSIGFVPTMGFLHEGHLSLIKAACDDNDKVVISVFVNPAQFGPNEDYDTYPRDLAHDLRLAYEAGVDCVFAPQASAMYPSDYASFVEVGRVSEGLCGASRPGFFRGVATVVLKLFNIVKPDLAYFGQKDAQQAIVLQQMVKDLNLDLVIKVMPIVREWDGLALSSRNKYLSLEQRQSAPQIRWALLAAAEAIGRGEQDLAALKAKTLDELAKIADSRLDYLQFVAFPQLTPLDKLQKPLMIAVAVYLGDTRLIDNIVVE